MESTERATRSRMLLARDDERGFTLIELLVVVIIIGILAGVAIPTFLNQREKAYQATVKKDLDDLGSFAEAYQLENDTGDTSQVAPSLEALETEGFRPSEGVEFDEPLVSSRLVVGSNGEDVDEQVICWQARHAQAPGKDFYAVSTEGYPVREVSEDDPGCASYAPPETDTPMEEETGYDEVGNPVEGGPYGPCGDVNNPESPCYNPTSGYDEVGNPDPNGSYGPCGDVNNPASPCYFPPE